MMLASEHPWVKSYFRGRRSRNPCPNDGADMEPRAPYALIGLFVLAADGAVFGFVYRLHNSGGLRSATPEPKCGPTVAPERRDLFGNFSQKPS
jgi:hypothetical protein